MIIKNILAFISVLFIIVVIVVIFNSVNNSLEEKKLVNNLNLISDHINYLCNINQNAYLERINLLSTKTEFKIYIPSSNNNSLCIQNIKTQKLYCEKYICNITSYPIMINTTKYSSPKSKVFNCDLEKKSKSLINITCSDEYEREVYS